MGRLFDLGCAPAATHRKIWNMLLLLSFIGVAASGVILTVRIDYGVNILPRFRTLFWHVETGIAMTVISVFHIIWHLPYFKAIMRARK